MIAMKLYETVLAKPVLTELTKVRLSAKTAYQIAKLLRLVDVEAAHHETERVSFIKDLGTVEGDRTTVTSDNWPEFERRIRELNDLPVELDANPLTLESFGTAELSGADVLALGALLVE